MTVILKSKNENNNTNKIRVSLYMNIWTVGIPTTLNLIIY